LSAESRTRNIESCCVTCAIKKNVIVASKLYNVADVQFTVDEKKVDLALV